MDTTKIIEAPFWLEINGRRIGSWTCSPEHLPALAAGWLLAEGYIEAGSKPPELVLVDDDGVLGIRATLPVERVLQGDLERRHRREHGCGLMYFVKCAPERIRGKARARALPGPTVMTTLFRQLFAGAEQNTGGMHSAALTDGKELLFHIDEIGRHNAVDKVVGMALLSGRDPRSLGLVVTARISGEIAKKAARAGLAWIASRSVPTSLAVEIAAVAGMPLLARAASKEPYLHYPGEELQGA